MKTGLTLTQLAEKIQREEDAKRDFIVPTDHLELTTIRIPDHAPSSKMTFPVRDIGVEIFTVNEHAHGQIASRLDIPKKFYDRMRGTQPDMFDDLIGGLWRREPEPRLVRTAHGRTRAFMSNRYRIIDNAQVAETVLPILGEQMADGKLSIVSAQVTERKFYLKVVYPKIEREIEGSKTRGDIVRAGAVYTNSETGEGSFAVSEFVERLACVNGMMIAETIRQHHAGRASDSLGEILADDTKEADDRALLLKVRDMTRASLNVERFEKRVEQMSATTQREIKVEPVDVVEVAAKSFDLSKSEQGSVLQHLLTGGDMSQWGVINAVTRTAEDVESYDRATELERLGGKILELTPKQWDSVATAKRVA